MDKFKFMVSVQPRYGDFDMLGHLNNAVYLTYYELARIHYFKAIGWKLDELTNVVAHLTMDFLIPVLPDLDICAMVKISKLGKTSFTMDYAIASSDKNIIYSRAQSVQVCVSNETHKPVPLTNNLSDIITDYENL